MLAATAEKERVEDERKRLAQIRSLPLEKMSYYCASISTDNKRVICLLCGKDRWGLDQSYQRDEWTSRHFRLCHWERYFGMIPLRPDQERFEIIPWEIQQRDLFATNSQRLANDLITLDDVTSSYPIETDAEIFDTATDYSFEPHCPTGPIMIQRFVVVREGLYSCLCLGIRT